VSWAPVACGNKTPLDVTLETSLSPSILSFCIGCNTLCSTTTFLWVGHHNKVKIWCNEMLNSVCFWQ
jgi:hypothetical protein